MTHDELVAHLLLVGFKPDLHVRFSSGKTITDQCYVYDGERSKTRNLKVVVHKSERTAANTYYGCLVKNSNNFSTRTPEQVWQWISSRLYYGLR